MGWKKYNPDMCEKAQECFKVGLSINQTARALGIATPTLTDWINPESSRYRARIHQAYLDGRGAGDLEVAQKIYELGVKDKNVNILLELGRKRLKFRDNSDDFEQIEEKVSTDVASLLEALRIVNTPPPVTYEPDEDDE